jgi:hopanoid biosynthesis associated RND transporter like protein HpnN
LTVVSRTGALLRRLVRVSCDRPVLTLGLGVALAALSVWYAFAQLTFATSTASLLPRGQAYMHRFQDYEKLFGEIDDLIIAVEAPSPPEAKVYAGRLVRELRLRGVPLSQLTYRIDPKQFEGQALLYLSKQKLAEIRDRIFDYQEFMESFAARPTLDQLVEGLATQIAGAFVTGFLDLGLEDTKKTGNDLRFIEDLVAQISARIERPIPYKSPWGSFFSVDTDDSDAGYFLSDDERLLFILAVPKSRAGTFTGDREAIEGVREVIQLLRPQFPDIRVGVTGKAALSNDEMVSAFRDSEWASVVSFVLTFGLLFAAFLRVGKPVVMCLLLAVSLCWAIGFATLAIGHLSLFSVMFISIVIGIGIDYGIYFLFRYEEERFLGRGLQEALQVTAARSGPPILLATVTAAGTFYVLAFTDFRGVQELGIISGTAILFSWLAMMTLFPAALVLIDRRSANPSRRAVPRSVALERIRMPLVERLAQSPRTVLAGAAVATALSLLALGSVSFDYNLLNLQAKGTESVVWEKRILATSGRSGFAGLATAGSIDELRRKQAAFKRLPTVNEVDSLLMLIPEDQEEKQKIIANFAPIVAPVRIARPQPIDVPRLVAGLETLKRRLDIAENEAPVGEAKQRLDKLTDDIGRLVRKIRQTDRDVVENSLAALQQPLYRDFVRSFQRLQANLAPKRVGLDQVPQELRNRYYNAEKHLFLVQVHPAVNIWDREGARRFVTELRSVDPEVTGTPIITYEAIRLMERSYRQGTLYAVVLVSLVLGLSIRRPRETLLALLPLAVGLAWTGGLMWVFKLKFTLGNVFGLPLLLGAACEYGMNVVIRFMEGRDHGGPLIARSTVMGVLVAGLTNIVGFGSLLLADHRGIFGLGLLLTLGSLANLVAALVVLPVLLRMVQQMREARRARHDAASSLPGAPAEESERVDHVGKT